MSRTSRVLLALGALLVALLPIGVSTPAYAAGCATLHAADVAYGAPAVSGHLDDAARSACYTLDLPEGTVLTLSKAVLDYLYVTAEVTSGPSQTARTCDAPGSCRLSGPGPFVLTIARAHDAFDTDYRVRVLGLTGDTGCPTAAAGALGTEEGVLSGTIAAGDLDCRSVTVDGPVVLNSVPGHVDADTASWTLYDESGRQVCTSDRSIDLCPTTRGRATLLLTPSTGGTINGQIGDLRDFADCPDLSSSWFDPPEVVGTNTDGRLDCRTLSGVAPGDAVTRPVGAAREDPVTRPSEIRSQLVDADGRDACRTVDAGCVATGTAPFRVLTASPVSVYSDVHLESYPLAVKEIGPTSDCPVIDPVAFGNRPSDDVAGVGCRQFTARAGHRYIVRTTTHDQVTNDDVHVPYVFASDYSRLACNDDHVPVGQCDATTGDVTVFDAYGGAPADFTTGLYDLTSDAGCVSPPAGLVGISSDLSEAAISCQRVDEPAGTTMLTAENNASSTIVTLSYVDPSGASVCLLQADTDPFVDGQCVIQGQGPYRLLASSHLSPQGPTRVAAVPVAGLSGCKTVATGGSQGTLTTFKAGDPVAKCRQIPATTDPGGQVVHVGHNSGNVAARSILIDDDGIVCPGSTQWILPCRAGGSSSGTVVTAGVPTSSETVARADVSRAPVRWRLPVVSGTVRAGRTVTVSTGDADWFNPGGHFRFRWILDGRAVPGATGSTFTIASSATGRRLSVEVSAYHGPVTKVATSVPTTVARR